ncbi:MAG: alanine racemase [Immundisolibacteraceae bacterium]|nr:alanine racemase [Immundisolibacteraceae bacterium]
MREIKRTINLNIIEENFRRLQNRAPSSAMGAVVKADGYGLGMTAIANRLAHAGCRHFFVATLKEGQALRSLLTETTIFVLNGLSSYPPQDFHQARLIPVLNSFDDIHAWSAAAEVTELGCAIHVDTGMQRLGLTIDEFEALKSDSELLNSLNLKLLISHLACAEQSQSEMNQTQLRRFNGLSDGLPEISRSLANSSGIFLGSNFQFNLCRAGAALYGVNPLPGQTNPMQPVVSVSAPILQIRQLNQASSVGYGATATMNPGTRLATIAAGYADGYPRQASNLSHVQIGNWLAPVVGKVSMDLISVDISDLPVSAICVGDMADLIGPLVSIDDLAAAANTIGYEILTNLGRHGETQTID